MIEMEVALLRVVYGVIKEHRIQESMSQCLKGKRFATRGEKKYNSNSNITHQCIKSMAETELNIDGSKSIKKLILE